MYHIMHGMNDVGGGQEPCRGAALQVDPSPTATGPEGACGPFRAVTAMRSIGRAESCHH